MPLQALEGVAHHVSTKFWMLVVQATICQMIGAVSVVIVTRCQLSSPSEHAEPPAACDVGTLPWAWHWRSLLAARSSPATSPMNTLQ